MDCEKLNLGFPGKGSEHQRWDFEDEIVEPVNEKTAAKSSQTEVTSSHSLAGTSYSLVAGYHYSEHSLYFL